MLILLHTMVEAYFISLTSFHLLQRPHRLPDDQLRVIHLAFCGLPAFDHIKQQTDRRLCHLHARLADRRDRRLIKLCDSKAVKSGYRAILGDTFSGIKECLTCPDCY